MFTLLVIALIVVVAITVLVVLPVAVGVGIVTIETLRHRRSTNNHSFTDQE